MPICLCVISVWLLFLKNNPWGNEWRIRWIFGNVRWRNNLLWRRTNPVWFLRYGEDAIYEKVSFIILRFIDCKFVIIRLYRASVDGASVDLEAVPISVESLDPRFVFLLDAGDVIWIWSGAKSRVLNSFLIHKRNANLRLLWQIKYDYLPWKWTRETEKRDQQSKHARSTIRPKNFG